MRWAFQMWLFCPYSPTKKNGDVQCIKVAKWFTASYHLLEKHGTMFYKPINQRPYSRINLLNVVTICSCRCASSDNVY